MNININSIRKKAGLSLFYIKDKFKKYHYLSITKNYLKKNISRFKIRNSSNQIKKDRTNNRKKEFIYDVLKIFKKEISLFNINKLFNKLSKTKNKIDLLNKNKLNVLSKINNTTNSDYNIDFVGVHYSEHKLSILHLCKTKKNTIIKKHIKIEIDTKLIGDSKVENIEEVKSIIEDVIEVFGLSNPPTILLLGSAFFTSKTFTDSQLVVFSDKDPIILSKSPFLPDQTSIQYQRVSGDKLSSYHIVVYAEKNIIESWIRILILLDNPVVALSNASINIIDKISKKSTNQIYSILCDVEISSITIYIQKKNCGLRSYKLPYGVSLYKSNDEKVKQQLFIRLKDAILKITKESNDIIPDKIYLTGSGLDELDLIKNHSSIYGFKIYNNEEYLTSNIVYNIDSNDHLANKSVLDSFCLLIEDLIK
tara:strand:+ start:5850 stop:7115 length:1266 start_codon:yes stop_codon:yes gene_type:complete